MFPSRKRFGSHTYVAIKRHTGDDLRLRLLHQHQCFLYRSIVDARSSAVHPAHARVGFQTRGRDREKHPILIDRNGLNYYRAQQVKLNNNDIFWKRAPEDYCEGERSNYHFEEVMTLPFFDIVR